MKENVESGINIKGRRVDGLRQSGQLTRSGYPKYTFYGSAEDPFGDRKVVEDGIGMLEGYLSHQDPWWLYVETVDSHDPYYVPKEFLNLYKEMQIELCTSFGDDMPDKSAMNRRIRARFSQMTLEENLECLKHYLAFCSY